MKEASLKNTTLTGARWSMIENLAGSGVTFLVGIVLARLLSPNEFGILGIISIIIAISTTFIDSGFSTALIRKSKVSDEDYNTVFVATLVISVFFMLLLILTSGVIADFFIEPILKEILPVISVILLINALAVVQRVQLTKDINFKIQAFISLAGSLLGGGVGIVLALQSFGVWSLVWQQIVRQGVISFLLWFMTPRKPVLKFSLAEFSEIFGFSSKVLGANLINTIFRNIYNIIIGKFFSMDQLGYYNRADQFNSIVTNNLANVIQKVSFPTMSNVQANPVELTSVFRKFIIYTSIITFPLVLGLGAIAKPLIMLLLGSKWNAVPILLEIMCVYGIFYPLSIINLNMLTIAGRSDLMLKLEIYKKILFVPVFFVGYSFGLVAMLWATAVFYCFDYILNSYFSEKFFNYGILKQILDLLPTFIISGTISLILFFISYLHFNPFILLIAQFFIACLLYYVGYRLYNCPEHVEVVRMIKNVLRSLKKGSSIIHKK